MTQTSTETTITTARELQAARPVWAEASIWAYLDEDQCDSMTDYYATRRARAVFLGWSRHTRDRFDELRKAADTFGPVAHLGTGKGDFRVSIRLETDMIENGSAYWRGTVSPWHRDELRAGLDHPDAGPIEREHFGTLIEYGSGSYRAFDTRAAAEAFIAGQPQPHDLHYRHKEGAEPGAR